MGAAGDDPESRDAGELKEALEEAGEYWRRLRRAGWNWMELERQKTATHGENWQTGASHRAETLVEYRNTP